jgi:SLT domain-containing protein
LFEYTKFDKALVNSQQKSQPQVLALWAKGLAVVTPLLKYLHPLAQAAADALMPLLDEVGKDTQSKGFATFMQTLTKLSGISIKGFGQSLINIGTGLGNIFMGLAKSGLASGMVDGIVKMTKAFSNWTGGKGFTDFLARMKQDAPVVMDILKNLFIILGKILTDSSGGIGKAELQGIDLLLKGLTLLAKIPGFGPFLYNFIAFELAFSKFGSLKATGALWDLAYKSLGKLLLLKFGTFVAGVLGLETEGKALGEIWKLVGLKIVAGAKSGILWLGNWLKEAAIWTAGQLISAGAALAGWIAASLGIEVSMAGVVLATGGIVLAIGLLILGLYELYKHWSTVWGFIKRIAGDAWTFIKHDLNDVIQHFLTFALNVVKLADKAFGWIPGIGGKLKTAEKAIQGFAAGVNRSLNGIKDKNTNLSFNIKPPPGMSESAVLKFLPNTSQFVPNKAAIGTSGALPGLSWVGEQGPELVDFSGGETVFTNQQSRKMAGYAKGTPNVGFGITVTPFPTLMPGMAAMLQDLSNNLNSSVGSGLQKAVQAGINKGVAKAMAAVGPASGGGHVNFVPGGGTKQWAPVVLSALNQLGLSSGLILDVLYQMMTESGGNPNAVNRTDSNWLAGHPSVGLMQVIHGTFDAYAGRYVNTPPFMYGVSTNPMANIYAALNYGKHGRGFGTGAGQIGSGHGYAGGTSGALAGLGWVGERGPELVGYATGTKRKVPARPRPQLSAEQNTALTIIDKFMSGLVNTLSKIKTEQSAAIKEIQKYYHGAAAQSREKTIDKQSAALTKMVTSVTAINAKIAAATSFYNNEKSSLAGFADLSSLTLPADAVSGASGATRPTGPTAATSLTGQLSAQLTTLKSFASALATLKKMGLSNALLSQIVAMDPVTGLAYANAIISSGIGSVKTLNSTESQLGTAETSLAQSMTNVLYDSGAQAGKGFLSGLKAQKANLDTEMKRLGDTIGMELAKWFGVPKGRLPHFAAGGFLPQGQWGVVGEHGPEPIMVGSGGAIIRPNQGMRSVGGGRAVNVTVYTNEINPRYHAAQLGFELARRSA